MSITYRAIQVELYDPIEFYSKAEITNECWVWQGSHYQNGYGKLGDTGIPAHRISYELSRGPIPTNMVLDHLCRRRDCINPDHLEIVTLVENVMRGDSQHAINARKTHCKNGHEFTQSNIYRHPKRGTRHCKECQKILSTKHLIKKDG